MATTMASRVRFSDIITALTPGDELFGHPCDMNGCPNAAEYRVPARGFCDDVFCAPCATEWVASA